MKKKLIILLPLFMLTACWEVSSGNKIGVITKLAKQGLFIKTYEGQIIRGGFNSGTGAMGSAFNFTVENPETLKQLQNAMDKQQEVKIFYHAELATFFRSESENHFVDKVEVLTEQSTVKPANKEEK